jgi:hypothetical protein
VAPVATQRCVLGDGGPTISSEETGRARNAPHAARPCHTRGSGRLDLRFDEHSKISGRLSERRELGIEAKVCELSDEALGPHVLRAAIEMVGTEILELRAVLEHVVDGREQ